MTTPDERTENKTLRSLNSLCLCLSHQPARLIADRDYASNPARALLVNRDIEPIIPKRRNNKKATHQDGRPLRRCQRRWKVERLFAWLDNFRRVAMCSDRHEENYLGFVHRGCIKILLTCYL